MKTVISIILLMLPGIVHSNAISIPTPTAKSYESMQRGPWAVKNSWGLKNCGFQITSFYQGDSVTNLIEAATRDDLATSWGFLTVQSEKDVDKFVATNKPIAVYGLIPDIINNGLAGSPEKQQYLDYIEKNVKAGYSIGVCEWENSFYRPFAYSTETKQNFGYSHEEMAKMTKDQIYNVIRTALLRWKKDARNKMMMANACGLINHTAEIGVDLIGIETSEQIFSTQFKRALARGAARQFGTPWFEEVSAWFGPQITAGHLEVANWPYTPGVKYGGDSGHSMSHMKRMWYSSWFSGSGHIMQDTAQVFYEFLWSDPEYVPKNPVLSRFGVEAQKASRLWRTFDRGIPYTPFMIMLGKSAGRWTMVEKPFGILEPNEADLMVNKFIDQLYIDQSMGDGSEERFLSPSPYGDTFDVMINDAKRDSWSAYPVIIALGEIFWTKDDIAALQKYVKNGGILVVNELNSPKLESIVGSNMFSEKYAVLRDNGKIILGEKKMGNGTIFLSRNLNTVTGRKRYGYPKELLNALYKAYVPFKITGNVETLFNKTKNGWAVMVMNHAGITKPVYYVEAPTIDNSQTQNVTVSFQGSNVRITEAFGQKYRLSKKNGQSNLSFPLPPGEIYLFDIRRGN